MRVVDLFCGAGGFSEGFRLAGFDIICAVDKWQPAIDTFNENHRTSNAILADIQAISDLSDDEFNKIIPDTEVIIGSPPCIAFSNSNKSGKGDKTQGIKLIKAFLKIVARKKFKDGSILKYWLLENVPKAEPFIKSTYTAKQLGLKGNFTLKVKNESSGVYHAENFGVPSKRIRYFCGEFRQPKQLIDNSNDFTPLQTILNALGSPCQKLESDISDPNFPLIMKSKDITDHHYIQEIAEFQCQELKRLKEDKGYMGKMCFPENENRIARTILATMTFCSRESMAFRYQDGKYRLPTIREIASLMSFPIDYRFYGKNKAVKYRLVGNAVPPKMAYAFALAILKDTNVSPHQAYKPIEFRNKVDFYNLNFQIFTLHEEKPKRNGARFKYHIPYLKLDAYRVELTNYHSDFKSGNYIWDVEIHRSQGKSAKIYTPKIADLKLNSNELQNANRFVVDIIRTLPSFNEFQEIYCMTTNNRNGQIGPYQLLEKIKLFLSQAKYNENSQQYIALSEEPYKLPKEIAIGYFMLMSIINYMRMVSNG